MSEIDEINCNMFFGSLSPHMTGNQDVPTPSPVGKRTPAEWLLESFSTVSESNSQGRE